MRRYEIEFLVLGAALMYENVMYRAVVNLRETDFSLSDNRKLFSKIKSLFEKNLTYDEILLEIEGDPHAAYVIEFAPLSQERYAAAEKKLIELAKKDREKEIADSISSGAITREEALALLSEIESDRKEKGGSVREIAVRFLKKQEELTKNALPGISTGSAELDSVFTYRKELSLICARPSIGKTMTALKLLYNQAQMGINAQFFSLELTEEEVMARLIAVHLNRKLKDIVYGWVDFEKIVEAADEIAKLPIHIEPGPLTLPEIKAKIFQVKPDVVYIDYIQKVKKDREGSRKDFLDFVSAELLEVAKDKCPIVALAQLNRGARMGKDVPTVENIKETGNFEQDASNILLLHRNLKEAPHRLLVKIAKCRIEAANREIVVDFVDGIPRFISPAAAQAKSEVDDYEFSF